KPKIAAYFLLLTAYCFLHFARVAQLIERWSYKPEVEGLSPSLGTNVTDTEKGRHGDAEKFISASPVLRTSASSLSGRDSSRQNGDCCDCGVPERLGSASRPDQYFSFKLQVSGFKQVRT